MGALPTAPREPNIGRAAAAVAPVVRGEGAPSAVVERAGGEQAGFLGLGIEPGPPSFVGDDVPDAVVPGRAVPFAGADEGMVAEAVHDPAAQEAFGVFFTERQPETPGQHYAEERVVPRLRGIGGPREGSEPRAGAVESEELEVSEHVGLVPPCGSKGLKSVRKR